MSGLLPGCSYTLKLGASWDHIPTELVHAVQYDFKPASVDPSQPGQMKLDGNNGVSVILPHTGTDESSEFKGNKQPSSKECFLVVDNKTRTVYLEKISNTIRVKKYRTSKKPVQRGVLRREEDRASPLPAPLQTKGPPESPVPQEDSPPLSQNPPKSETSQCIKPETVKSEKCEPNAKRVKTVLKSSGNLSSESSGSDSDCNSSDESLSSDTENFTSVKSQQALNLAGGSALITPLGEPPGKQETAGSGLMDMLSQDLDLTDSDDDFD